MCKDHEAKKCNCFKNVVKIEKKIKGRNQFLTEMNLLTQNLKKGEEIRKREFCFMCCVGLSTTFFCPTSTLSHIHCANNTATT